MVVNSPSGTGRAARLANLEVAGKTGSAETHKGAKTHAWFVCFAPYRNPQIALVVLVEQAGHGGAVAAPIARRVLAAVFHVPDMATEESVQED